MIKPAYLYTDRLRNAYVETWIDPKYKYYYSGGYRYIPSQIDAKPGDDVWHRSFVSIGGEDEVIGCIQYDINRSGKIASNLSIISFRAGEYATIFTADLIRVLTDIFEVYHCRTLLFNGIVGNPALNHYISIIKRVGGRCLCTIKDAVQLEDGEFYDKVLFQVHENDYVSWKKERGIKKHQLSLGKHTSK